MGLVNKDVVSLFDIATIFPLYVQPGGNLPEETLFNVDGIGEEKHRPNLNTAFVKEFCARLNVKLVVEGSLKPSSRETSPELIFNYIYGVLHSPSYRKRYTQFLRTSFPRLPITRDYDLFRELAGFGGLLVDLHAREQGDSSTISFPIKGANIIQAVRYHPPETTGDDRHTGRVWINDKQYFEGVTPSTWRFPIGGYLPAERWLKDRVGRTLSYDDLTVYPRIVAALGETQRMGEIDQSITAHGGWPGAFA